eukprot:CAMPEP_0184300528 /NCGR_PEP_ID=MMETSP1049-20130417/10924_1 /TAXON_ID=77928 /ORGANISM="Proteomonas sulcata, Strain CCMP704" /LENGTH=60 /DNA_ID=CAMNT_0026611273 /DNA_START=93 /DNA_END=271 /DNA_ORIENTATION=+
MSPEEGMTGETWLTKNDLGVYEALGYKVIQTSTKTGQGFEELAQAFRNKTSILVGQSGVG